MRVAIAGRDIKTAHGIGTGRYHRVGLEAQAAACPAGMRACVLVVDFLTIDGDEVMVEGRIVELDPVNRGNWRRSCRGRIDDGDRILNSRWHADSCHATNGDGIGRIAGWL